MPRLITTVPTNVSASQSVADLPPFLLPVRLLDVQAELDRQGVLRPRPSGAASPWRVTLVNTGYEVCSHYPTLLVVPRDVSDDELLASAAFRSEGRLPVLTWGRHDSSGSLWRSSQPKVRQRPAPLLLIITVRQQSPRHSSQQQGPTAARSS